MTEVLPKEQLNLDSAQESGFISYYKSLPQKPLTTIRFFDRGEYYTVHGEDANLAAKELFHTNSVIKHIGSKENQIESVVLSKLNFESFIKTLLLVKQYRVEVLKQKTTNKNDWQEVYKASPGNLLQFEEILFGSNVDAPTNAGVLSFKMSNEGGKRVIGAAHIDLNEQSFLLSQFDECDSFTNVEALVVQLGCKECLIPASDQNPDMPKLKQVLSRNNLLLTERKIADFSTTDAVKDIGRILKHKEGPELLSTHLEMSSHNAVSALLAAIKYLELLSDNSNMKQFSLKSFEFGSFLHMDSAVLEALQVDSTNEGRPQDRKERTLLGLLDKCQTAQGRRLLGQWLRQPLVDVNRIGERQDLVEALVTSVEICHSLGEDNLKRIPDLSKLSRKLSRKTATLQDCYRLYQCIERLPNLCQTLGKYEDKYSATVSALFITPIQELFNDMSKFQEMFLVTLNMTLANQGEFVVKSEFDETLEELRQMMDSLEEEIQKQLKVAANDLSLDPGKTLKLETNSQLGYHFRVTLKEEITLRNNRSYNIIDSNKSGVRFRNMALCDLNNQYTSSREEYHKQQKNIAEEIISIAAGYADVVHNLGTVLSNLDCIYALATVAVSAPIPYCRPEVLPKGSGKIELIQCRHPCLELMDDISYIPNDCFLNNDLGLFHIITGPNMGGKSTFLRSIAINVLLAQVGSFVPCNSARISVVDSILARVGAGDCQMKGVSTFMAEMLETSVILKTATKDSFIIIDELGRGTSTYDGFGLAWAISENISKEIGSFCLFATHFHELTALEKEVPSVKNYHVTATTMNGALILLYQLKTGPCDRSFGIHVAELANFPPDVIEFAKRKARELEDDYGDENDQSEEALKRRKQEKKEGGKIMEEYLVKAKAIDLDSLTDEELQSKIDGLKDELRNLNNPWIKHLLHVA